MMKHRNLFSSGWCALLLIALWMICAGRGMAQSFTAPAVVASHTSTLYNGYSQMLAVAVDDAGNLFFTQPGQGTLLEQLADGSAVITLASGLSYPKGVAVDHNGYAYATDYSGHLWKVPVGGGTATDILTACNSLDGYYLGTQVVAADGQGNVYTAGNNETALFKISAAGVCSVVSGATLNDSTTDGMSHLAADRAGNLYYSVGANLYTVAAGSSSPTLVSANFKWILGLGTDAQGDLFVNDSSPDSYTGVIDEVPYVDGMPAGDQKFTVLPSFTTYDFGVASDGTLYTTDGNSIMQSTLGQMRFASTTVGAQSSASTVTLAFNSDVAISAIQVMKAGSASSEISNTGAGNCVLSASAVNAAGSSCTLSLAYTPQTLGGEAFDLELLSGSSVAGSIYVAGQGSGAGAVLDPGSEAAIGSNWSNPKSVAVDGSGNVYVADATAGTITLIAGNSTQTSVIATGLSTPSALAIGGDGSVYVIESGANRLSLIALHAGTYSSPVVLSSAFSAPSAVAVSGTGNLYVADAGTGLIYRMLNVGGMINTANMQSIASGFKQPTALLADASDALLVVDEQAGKIIRVASGTQSVLLADLASPTSIAKDPNGNLYVLENGVSNILYIPFSNGTYNMNAVLDLASGVNAPVAIAENAAGDLYLADAQAQQVQLLHRTAATLNFGKVNSGESSVSEAFTLSSIGDQPLTFGSNVEGGMGDVNDFAVTTTCTASAALAAGGNCQLAGVFTPTATGVRTETVTIASNAVNAATVSGSLQGVGTNLPKTVTTITRTSSGTLSFGDVLPLQVTVAAQSGSGVPTGSVQFYVNGVAYGSAVQLTNGASSINISGLAAISNTITASYGGDDNFAASAAPSLNINVALANTATSLLSTVTSSTPVAPGTSITLTAAVSSQVAGYKPTGSVTFASGATVLGTVSVNSSSTAVFTSTTLPQGVYAVVASYSGDSGFAASSSSAVNIAVEPAQYVVSSTPASITVASSGGSSASFVLTTISGYTGGVDFACTGLPANATCSFSPAAVYFASTKDANGNTVAPGAQTVTLTVSTHSKSASTVAAWLLPFGGLPLLLLLRKKKNLDGYLSTLAVVALLACTVILLPGCSNSNSGLTPVGSSTVTVTMTGSPSGASTIPSSGMGNIVKSFTFQMTVK